MLDANQQQQLCMSLCDGEGFDYYGTQFGVEVSEVFARVGAPEMVQRLSVSSRVDGLYMDQGVKESSWKALGHLRHESVLRLLNTECDSWR